MIQDAQSVTQADRAVYKELLGYFAGTARAKEVDDGEHDATWEMRILVAHRLASQPTSAEDAVSLAGRLEALAGDCDNTDGWQGASADVRQAAEIIRTVSRPTPDTQTAAIGAEAMDTRLVCEQCGKAGALFCEHVARGAALSLSQPVAAPQAEIVGKFFGTPGCPVTEGLNKMFAVTDEDIQAASAETERLARELNITNADHIALWLEANMADSSLGWLACRIVEAHEQTSTPPQPEGGTVEKIARILCEQDGHDPDDDVIAGQAAAFENYGPRWQAMQRSEGQCGLRDYAAEAQAILAALQPEKTKP